uniref:Putative secreted protein n=1 Tax=Panstrongylus lignarius TaxID=156445 RepID=A0A224Y4P3_9HEMI
MIVCYSFLVKFLIVVLLILTRLVSLSLSQKEPLYLSTAQKITMRCFFIRRHCKVSLLNSVRILSLLKIPN